MNAGTTEHVSPHAADKIKREAGEATRRLIESETKRLAGHGFGSKDVEPLIKQGIHEATK